ncbi:transglutaminase elicitor-like protein [Phytophthora infestans T30-4]|uniref:Transglutaminase elicitor-like protein n=1 Tax=Phytophthora infestans (strain T30-4) TaxID=403677 RepID=D0N8A8_PHYIT|nr:transglutaminase elicitor-like protein [Phytophthora infestans T30-4]EEY53793.1 transglutaminase elicitor-like protein [Phytophthora infestans T30-4]|eukprot:XP_002904424.1 transglutaminase elicitor-like protein [Phytophthora infestans T30-4]
MDKVSAQNGVDSRKLDTVCAKRAGATLGYCIPTWYGICDAWAPASIFEQEPNCPVTFNGVTFQPMDVKALMTDVYDNVNVSAVYAGERYYGTDDSIDEYGSHTDYTYRDLNPGLLHIVATNLSGLLKKTFIIDRDAGAEVWNQPVVSFKSIVYTNARLSWINETYTDGGLNIIGGEWLYGSNDNHPDFLWLLQGKPKPDTVTKTDLKYADVTMLLEKATACSNSEPPRL